MLLFWSISCPELLHFRYRFQFWRSLWIEICCQHFLHFGEDWALLKVLCKSSWRWPIRGPYLLDWFPSWTWDYQKVYSTFSSSLHSFHIQNRPRLLRGTCFLLYYLGSESQTRCLRHLICIWIKRSLRSLKGCCLRFQSSKILKDSCSFWRTRSSCLLHLLAVF